MAKSEKNTENESPEESPDMNEKISAKEACDILGISIPTLHRRISGGFLTPLPKHPAHRKRYRLYFRRGDVLKLRDLE